jgi:hypothetical protein
MTKWLVRILLSVVVLFLATFWQLSFSARPKLSAVAERVREPEHPA